MPEFRLSIEPDHPDLARLDRLTRQLCQELRALDGLTVARPETEAPQGAKSGVATTIGELLVRGTLSAGAVTTLAGVLIAWIKRTGARSVTVKRGEDEYTITGMPGADQHKLVEWLTGEGDSED